MIRAVTVTNCGPAVTSMFFGSKSNLVFSPQTLARLIENLRCLQGDGIKGAAAHHVQLRQRGNLFCQRPGGVGNLVEDPLHVNRQLFEFLFPGSHCLAGRVEDARGGRSQKEDCGVAAEDGPRPVAG